MPQKEWFIHIEGQTFGPLPTAVVNIMLKQGRLQVSDFAWGEGMTRWERIGEIEAFSVFIPPYPSAPIPGLGKGSTEAKPQAPGPQFPEAEKVPKEKAPPQPGPQSQPVPAAALKHETTAADLHDGEVFSFSLEKPKLKLVPNVATPAPAADSAVPAETPAQRAAAVAEGAKAKFRVQPRVPMDGKIVTDRYGSFAIRDISVGGLLFDAGEVIPVGTNLKFTIESTHLERRLDMTGVVVRLVDGSSVVGIGVEFTRVNPAYKRILQDYVNSKSSP